MAKGELTLLVVNLKKKVKYSYASRKVVTLTHSGTVVFPGLGNIQWISFMGKSYVLGPLVG